MPIGKEKIKLKKQLHILIDPVLHFQKFQQSHLTGLPIRKKKIQFYKASHIVYCCGHPLNMRQIIFQQKKLIVKMSTTRKCNLCPIFYFCCLPLYKTDYFSITKNLFLKMSTTGEWFVQLDINFKGTSQNFKHKRRCL